MVVVMVVLVIVSILSVVLVMGVALRREARVQCSVIFLFFSVHDVFLVDLHTERVRGCFLVNALYKLLTYLLTYSC